ncbi:DM13 domain-containing protein [Streptomyces sp. FIT100]|uniref:DM13 domain-containing protein n=1 Tax=Streptomyces sp. FIT100 TaxID=2837956 RepID=UPI0021C74175|nr:DM13 domain-containing protein [Streptomyces sp. FIT100]UUN28129.1 DM13 domain-containing protein [Streptomyces sp. FIT100]
MRKSVISAVVVVAAVLVAVGLYWFQPWQLWVDRTVRDELPSAAAPSAPPSAPAESGNPVPGGPRTLATGSFISHEHTTEGTVRIIELPDGSRTLRLEGLDTSNGPDLRVWITDAPVKEGVAGWRVFDDGAHVSLGKLKGNKGDQNYALPADVDLGTYTSVAIWCDRFDVSFGAAELSKGAA